MHPDLGSRMKAYEEYWCGDRLGDVHIPVLARIDGRAFHSFTTGMERPYDSRFCFLMRAVTKKLVEETGARCGYTQSDEISLVWLKDNPTQQIFFDGREHKLVSQLAALATCHFLLNLGLYGLAAYTSRHPTFDARIWEVPLLVEATNYFVWREQDAIRNSTNMLAQAHFSYEQLLRVPAEEARAMLREKGVDWHSEPDWFRRGSYFQRRTIRRRFTPEEIETLPPKHFARITPNLIIERSEVDEVDMPIPLESVENRVGVVFRGEEPTVRTAA